MADRTKNVFIVEDAPDIQILLARLLRFEGYVVSCANDGREALKSLRQADHLPGLILLDLMMPGMDGYEFRSEQERDARLAPIPIVVMTADGDVQVKAMKVGAKGYLKKPFSSLDLILATVDRFFQHS